MYLCIHKKEETNMEIVYQIFTGLFVTVVGGLIVGIALDKIRISKRLLQYL